MFFSIQHAKQSINNQFNHAITMLSELKAQAKDFWTTEVQQLLEKLASKKQSALKQT